MRQNDFTWQLNTQQQPGVSRRLNGLAADLHSWTHTVAERLPHPAPSWLGPGSQATGHVDSSPAVEGRSRGGAAGDRRAAHQAVRQCTACFSSAPLFCSAPPQPGVYWERCWSQRPGPGRTGTDTHSQVGQWTGGAAAPLHSLADGEGPTPPAPKGTFGLTSINRFYSNKEQSWNGSGGGWRSGEIELEEGGRWKDRG